MAKLLGIQTASLRTETSLSVHRAGLWLWS